ncbi:unnamed protein product [Meloidogyne enterolobii]|uniref:Uncharacterized protein n=1 Tax=Meloidogyne enterolobii TaxID=390850 RepID=A0ACB0ZQL4_MELEN
MISAKFFIKISVFHSFDCLFLLSICLKTALLNFCSIIRDIAGIFIVCLCVFINRFILCKSRNNFMSSLKF